MLGKRFLPRRHKLQPKEESFTENQDQNYTNTTSEKAVALCIEAAREICVLGEQYRKAFGSFRRSPVTATHCTLSAILFFIFSLKHCKRDDHDKDYGPKTISKLVNSGIVTLGELATSWMPARHYWKTLLAIVKDRQHSCDPQSPRCDNLNVAPSSPSSAIPNLTLEEINEPLWNNVLEDIRDGAEDFQSAEMWDSVGNYSFPDFEVESFFDDLPHGLDLFSSEHPDAWFAN